MNNTELKFKTVQLFGHFEKTWEEENAYLLAKDSLEKQAELYGQVIDYAVALNGRANDIYKTANLFRGKITQGLQTQIRIKSKGENSFIIHSPLPVLDAVSVTTWKAQFDTPDTSRTSDDNIELGNFIIAAIGYEVSKTSLFDIRADVTNNPTYLAYVMEYLSLKNQLHVIETESTPVGLQLAELRHTLATTAIEVNTFSENYTHFTTEKQIELSRLQAAIDHLVQEKKASEQAHRTGALKTAEMIAQIQSDATNGVLNYKNEIEQRLKLKHVTQRWQDVKRRAKLTLIGAGVFIVFLMFAAFLVLICKGQAIIDFLIPLNIKTIVLQSSPAGAIGLQLARIGIVAVPLVSYFWTLKIAVRILMRSLVIMDDADQRATIMDSYYSLTGDGMTDERALPMMLWAIFRPVPGHGPDGIEPPDFTEAINAGLKGKLLDPR